MKHPCSPCHACSDLLMPSSALAQVQTQSVPRASKPPGKQGHLQNASQQATCLHHCSNIMASRPHNRVFSIRQHPTDPASPAIHVTSTLQNRMPRSMIAFMDDNSDRIQSLREDLLSLRLRSASSLFCWFLIMMMMTRTKMWMRSSSRPSACATWSKSPAYAFSTTSCVSNST